MKISIRLFFFFFIHLNPIFFFPSLFLFILPLVLSLPLFVVVFGPHLRGGPIPIPVDPVTPLNRIFDFKEEQGDDDNDDNDDNDDHADFYDSGEEEGDLYGYIYIFICLYIYMYIM